MFESAVLRRSSEGLTVSAGQIAEAMLFYQKIHIVFDIRTVIELVKSIGPSNVIEIIKRPEISSVFCEEDLGIQTKHSGIFDIHSCLGFKLSADHKKKIDSTEDRMLLYFKNHGILSSSSKSFVRAFLRNVPVKNYSSDHFIKGGVSKAASRDLEDQSYVFSVAKEIISSFGLSLNDDSSFNFELQKTVDGFYVFTNINFDELNEFRLKSNMDKVGVANVLVAVQDLRADLALASHYGGDFYTSGLNSNLMRIRFSEIMNRFDKNQTEFNAFFKEILSEGVPRLSDLIDSGERDLIDFFKIIDKSKKFKDWIKNGNPDEGIVREYIKAQSSDDWLQSMPSKISRYSFLTVLGLKFPIASAALGAFDTFILDKVLQGWRPNHFVDNKLLPFLKRPN